MVPLLEKFVNQDEDADRLGMDDMDDSGEMDNLDRE